jgi:hypothetical protein
VYEEYIFAPLFDRLLSGSSADAAGESLTADRQTEVPQGMTVNEQLAEYWADAIRYPLRDRYLLARVAQYNRVKSDDEVQAKHNYLTFLKEILLSAVGYADPSRRVIVDELRKQVHERSFSDIVAELERDDTPPDANPLRLLARLDLPIYVTTSYFNFLERAIRAEGRIDVRTQICGDQSTLRPEHRVERDFEPSAQIPVVYHLHGLEDYPASLVLSEDDYLDFLVRVTRPTDPTLQNAVIPPYLRAKLTPSTLLLLGYRLQDWDFRATFSGLIAVKEAPRLVLSVAIQLSPREQTDVDSPEEAEKYLEDYFEAAKFRVEWSDSLQFVRNLWASWNRWLQGGV